MVRTSRGAAGRGSRLPGGRRLWVVIVVAILVVGGAAGAWAVTRNQNASATTTTTTQEVAAAVTTLKQTVSATGTIAPAVESNLQFGQSGTVTGISIKVGDQVTVGQSLATIDPTTLQNALALAQAQLTAAQAQLAAANASTSTNTTANASQVASANAAVLSAQTKVTAAAQALAQATLTSPIAGTVAAVNITAGQAISGSSTGSSNSSGSSSSGSAAGSAGAGSGSAGASGSAGSSSSASAQVVVISTSAWLVNTSVGAADLPKLKAGMQATITPDGATDPIFGTVSTVGLVGTTSGGTSTFPVTIAVTGSPTGLYVGNSATVAITVAQVADALTVPTAAIHDESGQTVVYQMKDGKQVSTPVTVGMVYGSSTQITAGIAEGDQVLVTTRSGFARTGTGTGASRTGGFGGGTGGFGGGTGGFGGGTGRTGTGSGAAPGGRG